MANNPPHYRFYGYPQAIPELQTNLSQYTLIKCWSPDWSNANAFDHIILPATLSYDTRVLVIYSQGNNTCITYNTPVLLSNRIDEEHTSTVTLPIYNMKYLATSSKQYSNVKLTYTMSAVSRVYDYNSNCDHIKCRKFDITLPAEYRLRTLSDQNHFLAVICTLQPAAESDAQK